MKTIKLKSAKKGQAIKFLNESEIYNVVKIEKGYDTGWKKVTYCQEGCEYDADFHKTFSADGELQMELVEA